MSTAVLRAALVIAAIVLGIFVLSKAFPTGQETSPPTAEDQGQTQGQDQGQMTTPTGGGGGGKNTPKPQTSPQVKGVKLAVLNGTDISNLAACTADRLTQLGYQVAEGDVGDASRSYEVTTISYAKQFEADANHIKKELFAKADLHAVGAGAISDVSIALGPDAATGPCESP